jgi:two-component system cell cycle sensor histidine kinase/response regulator CckA
MVSQAVDPRYNMPARLARAQQALRAEQSRAQQYLDIAAVMLVALDRDGRIELANRYACAVLGWSESELIGRNWFELCLPARTGDAVRGRLHDLIDGDAAIVENWIRTKSGEERLIEWRNTLLRGADGKRTGTLSSGVDITERRALEARCRQAQKMESVGQLACGVAHDFNNLLTVIIGYAEIASADQVPAARDSEELREILSAARSATQLTRQLLAFSRKQPLHAMPLDVNALITHMTWLMGRLIGENITVEVELARELPQAFVDCGQFEQVVMNLVINAKDSMSHGGRLTITTSVVTLEAAAFGDDAIAGGAYVLLAIADTGGGMSDETLQRLFEPFFTTKELGKGTGLGLATCRDIVKELKGHINVDTTLGVGTTFNVYLPCVIADVKSDDAENKMAGAMNRAGHAAPFTLLTGARPSTRQTTRIASPVIPG